MAGNGQEGRFAVLRYAGAFIAFMVGSGFATGQEVMQYYVAFGYGGFAAALLAFALLACAGVRAAVRTDRLNFAGFCGIIILSWINMRCACIASRAEMKGAQSWSGRSSGNIAKDRI